MSVHLKKRFRRELLALRRNLPASVRAAWSAQLRERLLKVVVSRPDARLFAFASLHGEPELMELAATLPAGRFLLPRLHTEGYGMSFHAWTPERSLIANRWGIAEPGPDRPPAAKPQAADVIAVPAVALARDGHRLGYGGGYYDRLLTATPAVAAGVVFDCFVLVSLPVEDHDARVGLIVTDAKTLVIDR